MAAQRCPICGRRLRLEQHAPGLEENFPGVTIGVCSSCHNGQEGLTARAYDVGMLHDHKTKDRPRTPRPEPERTWCLLQGSGDLLAAVNRSMARALDDPTFEDRAEVSERIGLASARMFYMLEASEDGPLPRALGPEPAKNLRRRKRRRKRKTPAPAFIGIRQAASLVVFLAKFSEQATTQFREADSWAAGRMAVSQERVTETLRLVASNPVRVLRGLSTICSSSALPVVEAIMFALTEELRRGIVGLMTAQDEAELVTVLIRSLRVTLPAERAVLAFLRAIAEGDPPERAAWQFVATMTEAA